jgi:hypothetical protein
LNLILRSIAKQCVSKDEADLHPSRRRTALLRMRSD